MLTDKPIHIEIARTRITVYNPNSITCILST